jgi:hypothetical protein
MRLHDAVRGMVRCDSPYGVVRGGEGHRADAERGDPFGGGGISDDVPGITEDPTVDQSDQLPRVMPKLDISIHHPLDEE